MPKKLDCALTSVVQSHARDDDHIGDFRDASLYNIFFVLVHYMLMEIISNYNL